jgi:hypothetical protein
MAGVSDDNKRFLMPSRETGYTYANPRSQRTEDQKNGMRALLGGVRIKEKASEALGKGKKSLSAYQKNHEPYLTNQKRSDAVQEVKKRMGSTNLSAAYRKGRERMGSEERSAAARKGKETMGEEWMKAAAQRAHETNAIKSGRAFRIDDTLTTSATPPPEAGSSVKRPAPSPAPSTDTSEEPPSKRPKP